MKRLFIYITALLLIGCGSESGSVTENGENVETIVMNSSQTYLVYPGDHIRKTSEDTQLIITHNSGEEESSVELIQGDAELIRIL